MRLVHMAFYRTEQLCYLFNEAVLTAFTAGHKLGFAGSLCCSFTYEIVSVSIIIIDQMVYSDKISHVRMRNNCYVLRHHCVKGV